MNKITRGKDYEGCGSESVWNYKNIVDEILSGDPRAMHLLLRYNRTCFSKLWGRQDFCWTNHIGRRFYCWVRMFENCQLVILTHNEKGTCYEFVLTGRKDKAVDELVGFFQRLKRELSNKELSI